MSTIECQDELAPWIVKYHEHLLAKSLRKIKLTSEEMKFFNALRDIDMDIFVEIHILKAHIISEHLHIAFYLFLNRFG